jgi:hypothetical protein
MKNRLLIALMLLVLALVTFPVMGLLAENDDLNSGNGSAPPKDAVVHWAKGQSGNKSPVGGPRSNPNLSFHGGPVLNNTITVHPIFWGVKWADTTNFVKDKITGMLDFYTGMSGSSYAATNTEYTDGAGHHVTTAIVVPPPQYGFDTTPAAGGSRTINILAEACKMYPNPSPNDYYPVYVDIPRGSAGYCAWHSAGTCNGVPVEFAFFFNLDGDAGCDPQDGSSNHSQGLEAIANVSGHELSETMTDTQLNAWYDNSGSENSDKCAWSFGTSLLNFTNGTQWKVQGNWSNAAYNSPTRGYANRSGQKGCLDGGNYQ